MTPYSLVCLSIADRQLKATEPEWGHITPLLPHIKLCGTPESTHPRPWTNALDSDCGFPHSPEVTLECCWSLWAVLRGFAHSDIPLPGSLSDYSDADRGSLSDGHNSDRYRPWACWTVGMWGTKSLVRCLFGLLQLEIASIRSASHMHTHASIRNEGPNRDHIPDQNTDTLTTFTYESSGNRLFELRKWWEKM